MGSRLPWLVGLEKDGDREKYGHIFDENGPKLAPKAVIFKYNKCTRRTNVEQSIWWDDRLLPTAPFNKATRLVHLLCGGATRYIMFVFPPALAIHVWLIVLRLPSVFQGLCLRGERQEHARAEVPRVPMWYSCRSHRHESPRNLLQGGCHYCCRLRMNELICCSETSYQPLIRVTTEERTKIFFLLMQLSRAMF